MNDTLDYDLTAVMIGRFCHMNTGKQNYQNEMNINRAYPVYDVDALALFVG